jgi:hypothetical protein
MVALFSYTSYNTVILVGLSPNGEQTLRVFENGALLGMFVSNT